MAAGLVLALGVSALSCNGDSEPAPGVAGRSACATIGRWSDGAVEHEQISRDERGRLVDAETRDGEGASLRRQRWTWDGALLQATDRVEAGVRTRLEYDYEFDRLLRITRRVDGDVVTVTTYGYAGAAMVTQDIESRDGTHEPRHATITGDLTDRTRIVDCAVTDRERCQTWVFEQPDRVADHWTRATIDFTRDGAVDLVYTRTLDAHGLELNFVETAVDPRGGTRDLAREVTTRDADGLELGYQRDVLEVGAQRRFRTETAAACASTRMSKLDTQITTATRHGGRSRLDLDPASLGSRRLRRAPALTLAP